MLCDLQELFCARECLLKLQSALAAAQDPNMALPERAWVRAAGKRRNHALFSDLDWVVPSNKQNTKAPPGHHCFLIL